MATAKNYHTLTVGTVFLRDGKPVYITRGSYYGSNGGVSNFWYWRHVRAGGKLGKEYNGYDNEGRFTVYPGSFILKVILQ